MSAASDPAATGHVPTYAYKPSLIGAPCSFALERDGLRWQIGARSGHVPYDRIRRIRLSYRPVTMQSRRYITEIWSPGNPKIQIASASWRSLVEQETLDRDYTGFITELHRRLAAAGSTAQLQGGMPAIPFWLGAAVFSAVMVAMAVLVVRALQSGHWAGASVIGVFFLVFVVQIGNYFRRNRPVRYSPDALPAAVLPKV